MKKIMTGMIVMMLSLVLLAGCGSTSTPTSTSATSNTSSTSTSTSNNTTTAADTTTSTTGADTDQDGLPDTVEKTYGTNPYSADTDGDGITDDQDNDPAVADMPFTTDGAAMDVKIVDARVEDNAAEDHLEITLKNTGTQALDQLELYYTVEDTVAGLKEAYYQPLTGVSLAAGEETTLHFDNGTDPGHFLCNFNGIYGTSENGPTFTLTLHDGQNTFTTFTIVKDTGAAEVAD